MAISSYLLVDMSKVQELCPSYYGITIKKRLFAS